MNDDTFWARMAAAFGWPAVEDEIDQDKDEPRGDLTDD